LKIFETKLKIIFYFLIIFICPTSHAYEKDQLISLKIENFFKNLQTLEANFIQVSPSGDVSNGKIYLDLPGKMRIDYENPDNLLITCQGFWIVIQDRDSKTTNNVPLKSSPFSIFLEDKSILNNENFKTKFGVTSGVISLEIKSQEKDKLEGIVLEFSETPFNLKKWIILDTFGESTTVLIQDAKYNNELSHLLFFPIDFPEPTD
jgi:outer membrane lipoprotein-sorting protein